MPTPCLVVLTARGTSRILQENGTQAWRLKKGNAEKNLYCVCVQNRENGHWGGADHDHHQAFMVGLIRDVVPSPERPERFLVRFSRYTMINSPNAWPGLRNPVRYSTLDEFGITDPDSLEWKNVRYNLEAPKVPETLPPDEEAAVPPLTIPEAKAGLALGLGVPETAIEITVKY
jgi:hypothetical protein